MTEPDYKVYEADLTEFLPDEDNANRGTERGAGMIRKSLQEVGAGRSLVADKNNILPAGNKTQEAAVDVGITRAIVVETDGDAVIVHKRRDWDLSDKSPDNPARKYAYFDNRTGQVSLDFDPAQIAEDLAAGVDLSGLWSDIEISNLLADSGEGPQRPDFGGLVDQFEHDRGISPKDGNWFYVEFYGDDDTFGHLSDLLEEHLKGKHELDRAFFQEMADNYLAKPE